MNTVSDRGVTIKVTQTAYDLAMRLFGMQADVKPIPVTKDMLDSKLSELLDKNKRVAARSGQSPGRYGKPGVVRLLVSKEQLLVIPNRAPRLASKARKNRIETVRGDTARPTPLSIDALEAFVRDYRKIEDPMRHEKTRVVESRISEIQQHLGIAKGIDFRNTLAMANAQVRQLDEIERDVQRGVLDQLNPGEGSPLYEIWRKMA